MRTLRWDGEVMFFLLIIKELMRIFEMGVVRHERGLEDFEMGVESWII